MSYSDDRSQHTAVIFMPGYIVLRFFYVDALDDLMRAVTGREGAVN